MSGSESSEIGPDIPVRPATPLVGQQGRAVIAAVSALCGRVPLDAADRGELDSAMRELRAVRSFYDTMDILIARRSRQLAEAGKAGPAPDTLAAGGRRSKRDAKAAADRERTCDRLPIVEDALTSGAMSAGHVDAIANATAFMNDDEKARFDQHAADLTRRAAIDTVERFARYCYQLARRVTHDEGQSRLNDQKTRNNLRYWIDNHTGMYHIHCELDPETGARVITAITHHTNTVKHRKPTADEPVTDEPAADAPVADDAQPAAAAPPPEPRADHATPTADPEPEAAPQPTAASTVDDAPASNEPATATAPVEPVAEEPDAPAHTETPDEHETQPTATAPAPEHDTPRPAPADAKPAAEPEPDAAPQPTPAPVAHVEPVAPERQPTATAPAPETTQPETPDPDTDATAKPAPAPDAGQTSETTTDRPTTEPTATPDASPAANPEPPAPAPAAPKAAPSIEKVAADAFVELITGAQSLDRRVPEVSVLIDLDTLLNGLSHTSCSETSTGTLLPPETIRRLACDGDLIPIVLGSRGETLDVGRSSRLATPAQRRALRAMYATCAHPGCQIAFDLCDIHHLKEWKQFGPTDLNNLVPLCSKHHHMVHEGGWKLAMRSDRTIRLARPDGTIHFQDPTINRRAREPAA